MIYKKFQNIERISEPSNVAGVNYVDTKVSYAAGVGFTTMTLTEFDLNRFLDTHRTSKISDIRGELVELIEAYAREAKLESEVQ